MLGFFDTQEIDMSFVHCHLAASSCCQRARGNIWRLPRWQPTCDWRFPTERNARSWRCNIHRVLCHQNSQLRRLLGQITRIRIYAWSCIGWWLQICRDACISACHRDSCSGLLIALFLPGRLLNDRQTDTRITTCRLLVHFHHQSGRIDACLPVKLRHCSLLGHRASTLTLCRVSTGCAWSLDMLANVLSVLWGHSWWIEHSLCAWLLNYRL